MMNQLKCCLSLLIALSICSGCDAVTGEEIGRLSIEELTQDNSDLKLQSTTMELEAGEIIDLWADMNMEYEGKLALEFQLLVIMEGDTINMLPLNPFERDITVGEVKSSFNDKTSWRFSGRMDYLEIENSGTYEFQTLLLANENANIQINKADLVFKK